MVSLFTRAVLVAALLPQSATALSLNGHQETLESQDSFGGEITNAVKKAIESGDKITLQATCHSYSGVVSPVDGGVSLSLLQFAGMKIDKKKKLVTVQPGVRFCDTLKPLKAAGLSLQVHGDYSGQTVIGAVMTGTHGYGFPTASNFVTELKVINGLGKAKTLTPEDPLWGSWLNSNGGLGVVTELTMKVVDPFNIDVTVEPFDTLDNALASMMTNPYTMFSWNATMIPQIVGFQNMKYQVKKVDIGTTKAANRFVEWGMPYEVYVADYMTDFAFPPSWESKKALNRHCHQETPQVFEVAMATSEKSTHWEDGTFGLFPAISMDISFTPAQANLAIQIINSIPWPLGTNFYARYMAKDIYDMPLSPYFDGPRVGVDISLPPLAAGTVPANDPDVLRFHSDITMLLAALNSAGVVSRYHTGKSGFEQLRFWDPVRLGAFWAAKGVEDPQNVFTNKFMEMLQRQSR